MFGMGTGGTPQPSSPVFLFLRDAPSKLHQNADLLRSFLFSQALDLLVSVRSTHCCAYTPDLSTSCSPRCLIGFCRERPHLGAGFALRCFQRLSFPNVATQLYPWRDNWYTIGSSTPVLSYWEQPPSSLFRPRWIGTELSHDVLNPAHVPL